MVKGVLMRNTMRSLTLTAALSLGLGLSLSLPGIAAGGQSPRDSDTLLSRLPNLTLKESGPRKYSFVCDYFTLDPTETLLGKERVSGEYTARLPCAKRCWVTARLAHIIG